MNARAIPAKGWVTVAAAAEALTRAGDVIDASNVSRYLARFPELPQEKIGKYRFLDLAALAKHRGTNVLVGEKRAARDVEVAESAPPSRALAADDEDDDEVDEPRSAAPSELNQANVKLKHLRIREAELDLAVREGKLIPDHEVLALVSGVMQTFVAELERQETAIATAHGREFAATVRRARKLAQTSAAGKLAELARKHLPAHLAAVVVAPPAETSQAA